MLLNLKRYFSWILSRRLGQLSLIFLCLVVMTLSSLNIHIYSKLPNEELIRNIELQIPLKIYSSDKKLIGEFGEKRRTALKFREIEPKSSVFSDCSTTFSPDSSITSIMID